MTNHTFTGRDIIAIEDFTKEEIHHILSVTERIKRQKCADLLKGLQLGSCFFEPSTRTRLSFESAMLKLGGSVIGFNDHQMTSIAKGESLHDTMKMMENYVDAIVIRHPLQGSAQWAADSTGIPVINAGDGSNQHPTQTLLDLFTIYETQGSLENLHIAMVGDLKHGRTVHSLAKVAKHFNMRLYFISPPSLEMPSNICNDLRNLQVKFSFHRDLYEVINKLDILYMTRLQEERFTDNADFKGLINTYTLTKNHLKSTKDNLKILHPLPRTVEIEHAVDITPHAHYFQQAHNALFVRKALLGLILGKLN